MSIEIELKLTLSPRNLRRALHDPWLQSLATAPVTRDVIISTYYDTGSCALHQKGITLRVRRIGPKRLQTVKTGGYAAPFARKEWEKEISSERPDFAQMRGTALEPVLNKTLQHDLRRIFETRVRRTTLLVTLDGAVIEIALDQGTIKCGRLSRPISEMELELKAGDPAALYKIAARLSQTLPVRYCARTKSERGYALFGRQYDRAVRREPISLQRHIDTATAFQVIGFSCLHQFVSNENAVRRRDSEGIHQMRVGLRRLRAAIAIFKGILKDRQSESIKIELKWFTEQLAAARDYDVFARDSDEIQARRSPRGKMKAFQAVLLRKRASAFAKAGDAIAGERYRKLTLSTALWLANGNWRRRGNEQRRLRSAKAFAKEVLATHTRKVVGKLKKVDVLDARHRHKLRIAVKKLRYATEFFDALFDGAKKKRKAFGRTLEKLLTELGKLNDIRVRSILADEIGHETGHEKDHISPAVDIVKQQGQRNVGPLLRAVKKAGAHLGELRPFWE